MLNQVALIGNVGTDIETKRISNGTFTAKFKLAVESPIANGETLFIWCTIWGKKAEAVARYCSKGQKVAVTGKLIQSSFTGKNREKITMITITADGCEFLSKKEAIRDEYSSETGELSIYEAKHPYEPKNSQIEADEDDLPF